MTPFQPTAYNVARAFRSCGHDALTTEQIQADIAYQVCSFAPEAWSAALTELLTDMASKGSLVWLTNSEARALGASVPSNVTGDEKVAMMSERHTELAAAGAQKVFRARAEATVLSRHADEVADLERSLLATAGVDAADSRPAGPQHVITLDQYERDNLLALLKAVSGWAGPSLLTVANTGDWVMQIAGRLNPAGPHGGDWGNPNLAAEGMVRAAEARLAAAVLAAGSAGSASDDSAQTQSRDEAQR